MKKVVKNGSKAVVINEQDGAVWANLYVNAHNGIEGASITSLRWSGRTVAGAKKWAAKQLGL